MTNRRVTGGAAPQNKAVTPSDNKGAQPPTSGPRPANPPSGPSGVSPSGDGRR